jgi:acetyltransferase
MEKIYSKYSYIKSLTPFFYPKNIAILNAKNELSKRIIKNLIDNPFGGILYPINKESNHILGIKCYPSLKEINDEIDLLIITEDYPEAFNCMQECILYKDKIKAILMISSGFREDSKVYDILKKHFLKILRQNNIRLLGSNSTGLILPYNKLNISIIPIDLKQGNIAFLTQSGSLGSSIIDWSIFRNIGFSAFVNVGTSIDVNLGELIDYFGHDPHTKSIIIYLETLRYPSNFLSAAREISLSKPIIVLKSGKYHTSRKIIKERAGYPIKDEILNAAFRRSGILTVENIEDLFYMAEILSEQEIPKNNRLAILSNGMGPALLALDKFLEIGGKIQNFDPSTIQTLKKLNLKKIENPLILPFEITIDQLKKIILTIAKDTNQDGILLILTPYSSLNYQSLCESLIQIKQKIQKPILICFMGGKSIYEYIHILRNHHIPTFEFPDIAVKIFNYMFRYYYSIKALYETPYPIDTEKFDYINILQMLNNKEKFNQSNSIILTNEESLKLLQYANFNVDSQKQSNYLLNMGCFIEPIFGPILFYKIKSFFISTINYGLVPLNSTLAKRMIESSSEYNHLKHLKNLIKTLEILLVHLSDFILEFPQIKYVNFYFNLQKNTYNIYKAKVILYHPEKFLEEYKPPVIRPYPKQYIEPFKLKSNKTILIRPIKPEDEPLIIKFHYELSERSVYQRYLQPLDIKHRITHERLIRICFLDYDREIALIVFDPEENKILGVGRLSHHPYNSISEFAILIADQYQGLGLGKKLLSKLIEIGKKEKKEVIYGIILKENVAMIKVCEKLGFNIKTIDEELVKAEIYL